MFKLRIAVLAYLFLPMLAFAQPLDKYEILNHLDNYGNLYLRNKPYTSLPDALEVKGNLNIAKTRIEKLPQGCLLTVTWTHQTVY